MSRPGFCPGRGAELVDETAVVGIADDRTGDVGYDCSCRACGWSGEVFLDDEQGEYGGARRER